MPLELEARSVWLESEGEDTPKEERNGVGKKSGKVGFFQMMDGFYHLSQKFLCAGSILSLPSPSTAVSADYLPNVAALLLPPMVLATVCFEIVLLAVRDLSDHGFEYSCERYAQIWGTRAHFPTPLCHSSIRKRVQGLDSNAGFPAITEISRFAHFQDFPRSESSVPVLNSQMRDTGTLITAEEGTQGLSFSSTGNAQFAEYNTRLEDCPPAQRNKCLVLPMTAHLTDDSSPCSCNEFQVPEMRSSTLKFHFSKEDARAKLTTPRLHRVSDHSSIRDKGRKDLLSFD
ncbi:hemoglobin subunit alpha-D [Striga asiatica]|uniref:Hemoglobin subunit alpha-D n=1 Tax=Striga asiatica TaxID=4170 RepID=A0A5A7Q1F5_STRAF|nr:hemoglobin subunit alpha-D [Striga asiatica]